MNQYYQSLIKDVLTKEKIDTPRFIQGLAKYNIFLTPVNSLSYKKRPYVIYQGVIRNQPVIIKLLIRQNYHYFFERELFVYQNISKIITGIDKFLPELISFSSQPTPYMIIKYYRGWKSLGQYNRLIKPITRKQLEIILNTIFDLNWPKEKLEKKAQSMTLKTPFITTEPYSFYFNRFQSETKNTLAKIFNVEIVDRLNDLFVKTQFVFNRSRKYFCWGDANPSNILVNSNNNKFTFKFIDFEKTGYSYLARDYTTLYYSIYLKDESLALFMKSWLEKKDFGKDFWQIFYFKLLIYSFPHQFRYFGQKKDFINQKKIVRCAKICLSAYENCCRRL